MTEENADTETETEVSVEEPTAGSEGEISIPKHRFDEVTARLKRTEDELAQKDQLIQNIAVQKNPQSNGETELGHEELGVEPEVFNAASKIAAAQIAKLEKKYQTSLGHLANESEETRFMIQYPDAAKNVEAIKAYRNKNHQITGNFAPLTEAYKGWVFDQNAAGVKQPAKKVAKKEAEEPKEEIVNTPDASATKGDESSSESGNKTFNELTPEEMEANLTSRSTAGVAI